MAEKVKGPAVDEDQSKKRARTGQADKPSTVGNFATEREQAAKGIDRSGSPAVPYATRIAARQEAVAAAAGDTKSTKARAEVAGEDVGPTKSVPVPDPTADGPSYVEPEIQVNFVPEGSSVEDVRAGKVS